MIEPNVTVLYGGQLSSEGKGNVLAHIAKEFDWHVRTGDNSGHADNRHNAYGCTWRLNHIPTGWVNSDATLIIGAGGRIDPVALRTELEELAVIDPSVKRRLHIDGQCRIWSPKAKNYGFRFRDLCGLYSWYAPFLIEESTDTLFNAIAIGKRVLLEDVYGDPARMIETVELDPALVTNKLCVLRAMHVIGDRHDPIILRARQHRPTEVALTHLDVLDSRCSDLTRYEQLTEKAYHFIHRVEELIDAPVTFVGTSSCTGIRR